jgi:thiosulfate reductase / polysulfide reductase chain A
MKRTNPNKGRDEDPEFVPISWDEALDTVAERLNRPARQGRVPPLRPLLRPRLGRLRRRPLRRLRQALRHAQLGHRPLPRCVPTAPRRPSRPPTATTPTTLRLPQHQLPADLGGELPRGLPSLQLPDADVGPHAQQEPQDPGDHHRRAHEPHHGRLGSALYIKPGTDGAMALAIAHVILTEGLWEQGVRR